MDPLTCCCFACYVGLKENKKDRRQRPMNLGICWAAKDAPVDSNEGFVSRT